MPYATVEDARDSGLRDEDLLNLAADTVQHFAPYTGDEDEPDAAYIAKATRAERMVFRYLDATDGGSVQSKTLTGAGGTTYASDPAIIRMITNAMSEPDDQPGGVRRGRIV
jgi:hypothetical protein